MDTVYRRHHPASRLERNLARLLGGKSRGFPATPHVDVQFVKGLEVDLRMSGLQGEA